MYSRDWLAEFSEAQRTGDKSERTVASYAGALKIFAAWYEGSYSRPFSPRELTARDVIAYREELQHVRGLAAATVNVSLAALRAMAKWCMATGELREDPSDQIKFLELVDQPPHWLTRPELHRLLAEFERAINDAKARDNVVRTQQAIRDLAIVSLMGGAGLRVSEVAQLDLADIEIRERSGSVLVRNGKGRKQRSIPIGQPVRMAVRSWVEHRGAQPGALFFSQKGSRITPRQVQRMFEEKARRAGLADHTPHSMRHTFVKNIVTRSDLAVAQQLAGHRRIQTTARYAAPGKDELAAAAEGAIA